MKMLARAGLALLAAVSTPALAQSDPALVGVPAAASITGGEVLPVWQGGQRAQTTLTAACSSHAAVAADPVVGLPAAGAITGAELVALYQARALSVSNLAALCSSHAAFAGSPVVGLPGAGALAGPELVPIYQGGRRVTVTVAQIAALFGSGTILVGTLDFSDANQSAFIL